MGAGVSGPLLVLAWQKGTTNTELGGEETSELGGEETSGLDGMHSSAVTARVAVTWECWLSAANWLAPPPGSP